MSGYLARIRERRHVEEITAQATHQEALKRLQEAIALENRIRSLCDWLVNVSLVCIVVLLAVIAFPPTPDPRLFRLLYLALIVLGIVSLVYFHIHYHDRQLRVLDRSYILATLTIVVMAASQLV